MRLDDSRESSNVEDRRSSGGGGIGIGKGTVGIGTIVLALVAMYFGVDPSVVLNMAGQGGGGMTQQQAAGPRGAPADAEGQFVAKILGETEDTWRAVFKQQTTGAYKEPTLVLFRGATPTACGTGQSAMGPFYCPPDQSVYIDLAFFQEMKNKLNAPGDFAQAYVIAHEVGHHVQNLLGTMDRVNKQRSAQPNRANELSVRLELQADCYAGIWANKANAARQIVQEGDIEEALGAATAVGDDTLQRKTQGRVVPESFTHGSAAQRVSWFKRGWQQGTLGACDTFANAQR
jgi:predicted metalloprotease